MLHSSLSKNLLSQEAKGIYIHEYTMVQSSGRINTRREVWVGDVIFND